MRKATDNWIGRGRMVSLQSLSLEAVLMNTATENFDLPSKSAFFARKSSHGSRRDGSLSTKRQFMVSHVVSYLCWREFKSTSQQRRSGHVGTIAS